MVDVLRESATLVFDEKGKARATLGILQDVTERVRSAAFHAALSGLGQKLSAATTPNEAAAIVSETADELFGWDACFLDIYDQESDTAWCVLSMDTVDGRRGKASSVYATPRTPSPMFRQVLEHGAQLILRDSCEAPAEESIPRSYPSGSAQRSASLLLAPIRDKGSRNIGQFTIQSYTPHYYDQADLERFQILADYCSSALARTMAEHKLRNSEVRSAAFATLAHRLNGVTTPREAGYVIAETAAQLVGWDALTIDLYVAERDETCNMLMIDTIGGLKQEIAFPSLLEPPTSAQKRVLQNGAFIFLRPPDTSACSCDLQTTPFGDITRPSLSMMLAPARNSEGIAGIIAVHSYSANAYNEKRLETLQALADHCGSALGRIRMEKMLSDEHHLLRTLIDNLPDSIYVKDCLGRYKVANLAHVQRLGAQSEEQVLGKTDAQLLPEAAVEAYCRDEQLISELDTGIHGREELLIEASGKPLPVSTTRVALRNEHGELAGLVAVSRDITAAKRAQEQLQVFAELGRRLSCVTTPKQAGRVIVNAAKKLIGWDSCFVLLYSQKEDCAYTMFNVDEVEGKQVELGTNAFKGKPAGYTLRTIREGAQLVQRDSEQQMPEDSWTFGDLSRHSASLMYVPIRKNKQVIGVLSIQSYTPNYYSQKDLDLLESLAQHCSGAIERIQAQEAVRASEERYALAAQGANDGLWDWNLQNGKIYFSTRWKAMLGYSDSEIGDDPQEVLTRIHPADVFAVHEQLNRHLAGELQDFQSEHRILHRDGEYRWVLCRGSAVRDKAGRAVRVAGSMTDMTERKQFQDQLTRAAFFDPLTGLANRALFTDHLEQGLLRTRRRPGFRFAVLFVDLDRFKMVNDSLGHVIGDRLLQEIALRLKKHFREQDTVARLGGDEFTILLEDLRDPRDAVIVAERILRELAEPFMVEQTEIFTSASIGIALSTTGYQNVEEVLRDADTALYRAKETGRGRYVIFDQKMHESVLEQVEIEAGLRNALKHAEFELYYQPVVSLKDRTLCGFEALIRWKHPRNGLVAPSAFISVAEDTGLIVPIGEWVLRESCRQLALWRKRLTKARELFMSVNISPRQFSSAALGPAIEQVLAQTQLAPSALHLEITESAILKETEKMRPILEHWRTLGIRILLDDFGTGYSPLSHLISYPVDCLKIDRSFVANMTTAPQNQHVVRAIISLAQILKLKVIAEGAETAEQMDMLRQMGCGMVQGYFISKPVPASQAEAILQQHFPGNLLPSSL